MAQKIEEYDVKKEYGDLALTKKTDFISKHKINMTGLTTSQVEENQKRYGENQISGAKPKRWYHYFFESLFSPFNAILLGISLVLIYTDIVLPANPNPANIIVIICLVLISTFLEFFEEFRSNKAAEKLKELVQTKGTVIRNGEKVKIPFKEFTVGDIVSLSAGDMVPADLRVLEAKDLFVGQSSITGESDSIKKLPDTEMESIDDLESITDLDDICFMGTNVVSGSAKCVVVKVADDTYFGQVAHSITTGKPKTEFQKGIENILALRGDIPEGMVVENPDYKYASDLTKEIRDFGGFCIGGACYPEGHPESENSREDILNLKKKVDAGCQFLTTQMFFDNNVLYNFMYKIREAGITVPIVAGIMPVTNGKQISRICRLSGTILPARFKAIVDKWGTDKEAMTQAGIAYATDQIIDLLANGINGIHVYSMNNPFVAREIQKNLKSLIK